MSLWCKRCLITFFQTLKADRTCHLFVLFCSCTFLRIHLQPCLQDTSTTSPFNPTSTHCKLQTSIHLRPYTLLLDTAIRTSAVPQPSNKVYPGNRKRNITSKTNNKTIPDVILRELNSSMTRYDTVMPYGSLKDRSNQKLLILMFNLICDVALWGSGLSSWTEEVSSSSNKSCASTLDDCVMPQRAHNRHLYGRYGWWTIGTSTSMWLATGTKSMLLCILVFSKKLNACMK